MRRCKARQSKKSHYKKSNPVAVDEAVAQVRTHLKGYVVNVTDDHFPEYLHRMRHGAIRRLMVHYTWPVDVFVDLMIWQSDFGERYVEIWNPRANPQPKEPLRFKLPKRARSATRKLAQIEKLIRAILDQE